MLCINALLSFNLFAEKKRKGVITLPSHMIRQPIKQPIRQPPNLQPYLHPYLHPYLQHYSLYGYLCCKFSILIYTTKRDRLKENHYLWESFFS